MSRAIGANGLRPVIDRSFSFAEAKAALGYFDARKHFGKVVVSE